MAAMESATPKATPNLAGQRPAYLYLELKAYQAGARANVDMTEKVKFLSDDAIVKVAAFYASLDPAQPPQTTPPELDDPVAAGKAASRRPAPSATATMASAIRQAFPI